MKAISDIMPTIKATNIDRTIYESRGLCAKHLKHAISLIYLRVDTDMQTEQNLHNN